LSGGSKANILIITTGFPSLKEATATARYYSSAIQASTEVVDLDSNDLPGFSPSEEYTGMLVIGGDQSRIDPQYLAGVKTAWQAGLPLMVDGAASALVGKYYNYHPNTHPLEPEKDYDASQEALLINNAQVKPGLDLFDATIEPMAMIGNRWGWIIANSYAHPSLPSFGISEEAALEISSIGVVVLGEGPVFVLDLSQADLTTGDNGAYVFANGLLDVFAPLEVVFPEVADQNIAPIPPSTPDLTTPTPVTIVITPNSSPTPLPTLTVTQDSPLQFPKPAPTRTPRPTSTPLTVPPPPDSGQINLMILIASLSVLIVIFGVWINRNRIE
jgi:cyanophycinase-like exopeptidase